MDQDLKGTNFRIHHTLSSLLGELNSYFGENLPMEMQSVKHLVSSQIETGILDCELMTLSFDYFDVLEAKAELNAYHRTHLFQENVSLHQEIEELRSSLEKSELKIVELEEENKTLKMKLNLGLTDKCSCEHAESTSVENSNIDSIGNGEAQSTSDPSRDDDPDVMYQSQIFGAPIGTTPETAARLKTLHALVLQYTKNNRFEVAIPLCKQAISDVQETKGHDHQDVATLINILACVYRDQGKTREAINLLNECLEIRQKCFGNNHPIVASTLNNIAVLYGRRAKYREAEPLCRRALEIREATLGPNHPELAKQLNNYALLCQKMGKLQEVCEQNLSLCFKKNQMVKALIAYMEKRDFDEAEKIYKELLNRVHEKEFSENGAPVDPQNNRSIWMLAEEKQADRSVGTDLSNLEYKHRASNLLCNNPNISVALKNLANIYKRQGKAIAADIVESVLPQKQ
ncbi:hypothetical protein Ciccas_000758 [Cichlidogyrus casuarinus]|uniref:Kinesin light chain n=1 Tax=Cichlidogyrus casuarinus TaxID=1844966 RepID=A0ABD2QM12_9PLAT